MSESSLRERTINTMRELVKRNGITRDDGYKYFAFDGDPPLDAYAYKSEVELIATTWFTVEEEFDEELSTYLGSAFSADYELLMTEYDIFGEYSE